VRLDDHGRREHEHLYGTWLEGSHPDRPPRGRRRRRHLHHLHRPLHIPRPLRTLHHPARRRRIHSPGEDVYLIFGR
jgi:hypothetical protein